MEHKEHRTTARVIDILELVADSACLLYRSRCV